MNKLNQEYKDNQMLDEYDFSGSLPNKYAQRLKLQERLISLEPDVFEVFDTADKVNNALRAIIQAIPENRRNNLIK